MKHSVLATLLFLGMGFFAQAAPLESEGMKFQVETLAQKDDVIWGFDFLPDGRVIYTQRSGKLFVFDPNTKVSTEIKGTPKVAVEGQGGLLDVRVHPDFSKNHWIYLSYSEATGAGKMTTAMGRGQLKEAQLTGFQKLFTAHEPNTNQIHFGSRIVFADKYVFLSVGDRDKRQLAQSLEHHTGKVLRLNEDGSVPKDNPFVKKEGARPEIWSYGHRNTQGLTRHPVTGEIWQAEMGPRGGDEVNLLKPGANYGWPIVTYGREYYGPKIGEGTTKPGIEPPVVYWAPSISPSNIAFYNGDALPKWKGNLFLATLSGMHVHRVVLDGTKVIRQEELLKDMNERFRNVRQGPDGLLYVSTDSGKLARIAPVK